jgi:hypothetical protein
VLSAGRDEPRRWERLRVLWAVGLAAVCLVVGGLVGHHLDSPDSVGSRLAFPAAARPVVDLRVGGMDEVVPCTRRCLRVPLFNAGREAASVRTIGFDGWRMRARLSPVLVRPGSWENVRFALDVDCRAPRPSYSSTVQVQAAVAGHLRLLSLPLPNAVALVREQYDRYCPVGPPATPQDLRGVWVLESATGAWHDLVGTLLMRFAADGTFAWDSTGHLFDSALAADGSYELHGRRLTVTVDTVTACQAGGSYTWRVTLTAPDQLTMRFLHGGHGPCAGADDEVWLARRLLLDHRLPEMRALR